MEGKAAVIFLLVIIKYFLSYHINPRIAHKSRSLSGNEARRRKPVPAGGGTQKKGNKRNPGKELLRSIAFRSIVSKKLHSASKSKTCSTRAAAYITPKQTATKLFTPPILYNKKTRAMNTCPSGRKASQEERREECASSPIIVLPLPPPVRDGDAHPLLLGRGRGRRQHPRRAVPPPLNVPERLEARLGGDGDGVRDPHGHELLPLDVDLAHLPLAVAAPMARVAVAPAPAAARALARLD
ncbi:hypothetical protein LX36DRAFT_24061 [Colletotrichum falcatum]|nr:hypothetical protein LX36DRAFT_24061 [Colletotrichum falcatum]